MRFDYRDDGKILPFRIFKTYDADTGELLSPCVFADEETGEYERFVKKDGKFMSDPVTKKLLTQKGKCRLRIVDVTPPGDV